MPEPTLEAVYTVCHPYGGTYPEHRIEEVVHETGEHYVTFSRLKKPDGSSVLVAYVEIFHDEDPDHEEHQVEITDIGQVERLVDDPISVLDMVSG